MSDPNGWPDPDKPGVPLHPERDGWHWLHHPEDLRPMVTGWQAELHGWPSGGLHSPQVIVDLGYRYLGPALLPAEVAALVAEARAKALEEAAAEVDCGCAARQDVLARLATDGHKRSSYLCPHGDACCALAAAAIRALKEAPHD